MARIRTLSTRARMMPENTPAARPPRKSYATVVSRAWRLLLLRCCGQQPLFKNLFRMHPECTSCHLRYQREPGYFLGSIYINYGLTAVLVTLFYFALFYSGVVSAQAGLWIVTGFALVFPIWFFRYAPACGWVSITIGIRRRKRHRARSRSVDLSGRGGP